ncbi:DUF4197 domain-containing protein [Undibacterium fentianense]|uniref:DUF4197 domain-containing protein n=1 Tax=Undibacterium fentianense TaxID=2828728 RepID=A0A941E5Q4_9BURK|nr:DUF4197 domain-containing protein [Undibacterium fentianense]MBR7801637.1 DUF4197 domain-containing protein [Undibacterium fentianense]
MFKKAGHHLCILLAAISLHLGADASDLNQISQLSNKDANSGLKAALEQGANAALARLGVADGFLGNEKVKIPLPSILEKAKPLLKLSGQGKQLDELVVAMNRAAESAVPLAKPLLIDAIKNMSINDAKKILTGGETSVTDFFKEKTSLALGAKFVPIVKGVTDQVGLATKYNSVMIKAQKITMVPEKEASVESYVSSRAVDALYILIAEEEKKIRQDPIGTGSKIIGKVFGLLK